MLHAITVAWLALGPTARAQAVHTVGPGGYASIAQAVAAAADGDTIEVEPGVWSSDVDLYGRQLTIRSTGGSGATLITGGAGTVMLGAFGSTVTYEGFTLMPTDLRALVVADLGYGPSIVTLRDIVFEGATNPPGESWFPMGTSLYVDEASTVILEDVVFGAATPAGVAGGHIGVRGGSTLIAERTTVNGVDTVNGGGLYLEYATATFTDSAFVGGAAAGVPYAGTDIASGGAIYSWDSDLTLVDTTVEGASAAYIGGAIYAPYGSVTVTGGAFTDNTAAYGGALFCNEGAVCTIDGTSFERNTATLSAGAIAVWLGAVATVSGATICDNTASAWGGIGVLDSALTLTNTVLCGNEATDWGGGLGASFAYNTSIVTSRNNTWVGNDAGNLGAAMGAWLSTISSTNDLFLGNTTSAAETAVDAYDNSATLSVSHGLFFDNTGTTDATLDATTLLGVDPLLAAWVPGDCAASDLSPLWGSPVIDAGDPAWLDPDGSVSDIGAFGGEGADDAFWTDTDGDGVLDAWDCDAADPAVYPLAADVSGDGIDQDCDGTDAALPVDTATTADTADTADPAGPDDTGLAGGEEPGTDPDDPPGDTPTDGGSSRLPPAQAEPTTAIATGCGCDTGSPAASWLALALAVGMLRRKRP